MVQIFGSCTSGYIIIWNFHTGEKIKKIKVATVVFGMCLWSSNFIFVGCEDNSIKLVDINEGKILKVLDGHKSMVINVKKRNIPIYGECLISKGSVNDKIIIWINEK